MLKILYGFMLACLLFIFSAPVVALELDALNQQIEAFKHSPQARFVPDGLKRLSSYQGVMLLLLEQNTALFDVEASANKPEKKLSPALNTALQKAETLLLEARNNADVFEATFADVLAIETQANKTYAYHHVPHSPPFEAVFSAYEQGSTSLQQAIVATEAGLLNQARQAANQAKISFLQSIDAAMSGLVAQTSRAVSGAAAAGAKRYTPKLWSIVRAEFGLLKRYHENQQQDEEDRAQIERPKQPGYAFEMAVYTQKLAIQVKAWRRDAGSHEQLALEARQHRLALAQALALPLNYEQVGVDIRAEDLLKKVKVMQQDLQEERRLRSEELLNIKEKNEIFLRDALHQQRLHDQQAFQSKVSSLKSSFHVKLEQETFEKKRQAKVRALFGDKEVEILSNLDGSLLIRAKRIQFASGSSKLGRKHFDFLGRLKEALMLYPERQIRIEGHTDNLGGAKENRRLSLKRAEAVQAFLIATDMDVGRLRALGYGDVKPIVSNAYKKGRAMNRRIDVIIEADHE